MEILVFNKWNMEGVQVNDPGLQRYINLEARFMPKTSGKHSQNRFHKSKVFIVERLINKITNPGHKGKKHFRTSYHTTGKTMTAQAMVEDAFDIIEKKLKKNPIMVFVKAVENAAPREEIITIEYGGARYPKSVECAPQRRVDYALRQIVQNVYQKSVNNKKSAASVLADELTNAFMMTNASAAIQKKLELERQADSSR